MDETLGYILYALFMSAIGIAAVLGCAKRKGGDDGME